jgi:hypothetical protein
MGFTPTSAELIGYKGWVVQGTMKLQNASVDSSSIQEGILSY